MDICINMSVLQVGRASDIKTKQRPLGIAVAPAASGTSHAPS